MPLQIGAEDLSPIAAAMFCTAVALMALGPLSRLGNRSIAQWVNDETAEQLRRISMPWWLLAAAVALILFIAAIPQLQGHDLAAGIAAAGLIGLLATLLVLLTKVDAQCRLLPDPLTGLLAATGFIAHGMDFPPQAVTLADGIVGCAAGYLLLWLITAVFRKLKGVQAMGRGDFAMSAGLGAWLGWQSIPLVWLIASLAGLAAAGLQRLWRHWPKRDGGVPNPKTSAFLEQRIAFGPALALGGIITWIHLG
ncbi:MAG: prepilin peptidase [Betaproteobacteria bacterium]|jgi:prepilin signal peptidase PulO-like enzyme (type II secretory pathway)|nr:prepilin peptidase [Betaproteobacteria bacterium]